MAGYTFFFGDGRAEANIGMRGVLGARGAHLCEMSNLGMPLMPGFCLAKKSFQTKAENSNVLQELPEARNAVKASLAELELAVGRQFGHLANPLLLSIRADAGASCNSGYVANLGLNDKIVEAWTATESPHFVWDSYRRLIYGYAHVVRHLDMEPFEQELAAVKSHLNDQCQLGREHADCHIPTRLLRELVAVYQDLYHQQTGEQFPQDPEVQLWEALRVMAGTGAPTVQATVFSNYDFKSGTGIAHPPADDQDSLGHIMDGGWLVNAHIEDVARGDRVLQHITSEAAMCWSAQQGLPEADRLQEYPSLEEEFPSAFAELLRVQDLVEHHLTEAQGVEFAIVCGRLWVTQPRLEEVRTAAANMAIVGDNEHVGQGVDLLSPQTLPLEQADLDEEMDGNSIETATVLEEVWLEPPPSDELVYREQDSDNCMETSTAIDHIDCEPEAGGVDDLGLDAWMEEIAEMPAVLPTVASDEIAPIPSLQTLQMVPKRCVETSEFHASLCIGNASNADAIGAATAATAATVAAAIHEQQSLAPGSHASQGSPKFSFFLPVWQTVLAGGAAAMVCRATQLFGDRLVHTAASTQGDFSRALRLTVAHHGASGLFSGVFRQCARALPVGTVCCTTYVNLCKATPADDVQNSCAGLWRLGCATTAATVAHACNHPIQVILDHVKAQQQLAPSSSGIFRGITPALRKGVPGLAIELAAIDFVRGAVIDKGAPITPSALLASGAAAGIVSQVCLHPMRMMQQHMEAAQSPSTSKFMGATAAVQTALARKGPSALLAGLGPACAKNMPVVALNSLVRVGLVAHFTSSS